MGLISRVSSRTYRKEMTFSALLRSRALISLRGPSAKPLLQGVVTNDLDRMKKSETMYANILNKLGRVQTDVIMYDYQDNILVEVDKSLAKRLVVFLNKYNLKKDVKISVEEDLTVSFTNQVGQENESSFTDSRVGDFGMRTILDGPNASTSAEDDDE